MDFYTCARVLGIWDAGENTGLRQKTPNQSCMGLTSVKIYDDVKFLSSPWWSVVNLKGGIINACIRTKEELNNNTSAFARNGSRAPTGININGGLDFAVVGN